MIAFAGVSKSFGNQLLFSQADFQVNPGERVAIMGRNGSGKTTLFNLILGKEGPDEGRIIRPKNYRLACMAQETPLTCSRVLDEASLGLPCEKKTQTWLVEKILSGLGFSEQDFIRSPKTFSGGFQIRINLAKVLLAESNLLLLDEPTNFLDILSIRWLEKFLKTWEGETMIISHDRHFMDSICTHTLGIHRKKIRKIRGGTRKFIKQIRAEEEVHEKTRLKEEKKRKQDEIFISQFRAKARQAGMVQSRLKALEKRERQDKLERIHTLKFNFKYKPLDSRNLMSARELGYSYGGGAPDLIQNLSFNIAQKDRIAVIGPNGKGKSTLLRLLSGKLKPQSGQVNLHPLLTTAHFEQNNVESLDPGLSVDQEIRLSDPTQDRRASRDISGAMMFEGDAALKKISVLSGGEKSRVCLGKLLATPCQLLFLDEPTNHLDPESCDALMAAMTGFQGAVVFVTHNERLLFQVPNRLIIFDNGKQTVFDSGYRDFLDESGWREEEQTLRHRPLQASTGGRERRQLKHRKAELLKKRSRALKGLDTDMKNLEKKIICIEAEIRQIKEDLIAASEKGSGTRITALSTRLHQLQAESDQKYGELDKVTSHFDLLEADFSEKLNEINQARS